MRACRQQQLTFEKFIDLFVREKERNPSCGTWGKERKGRTTYLGIRPVPLCSTLVLTVIGVILEQKSRRWNASDVH